MKYKEALDKIMDDNALVMYHESWNGDEFVYAETTKIYHKEPIHKLIYTKDGVKEDFSEVNEDLKDSNDWIVSRIEDLEEDDISFKDILKNKIANAGFLGTILPSLLLLVVVVWIWLHDTIMNNEYLKTFLDVIINFFGTILEFLGDFFGFFGDFLE